MKKIKYFLQFLFVILLFMIFKFLGYKKSSDLGGLIFRQIGILFRSKKTIKNNLSNINFKNENHEKIILKIWENYGRIFADYISLKNFRNNKLNEFFEIKGKDVLKKIKNNQEVVVFISGHFNNFELMAMVIEKYGINLSAIYRPLNNIFLNKIMENIRKNYICKSQIPKGMKGTRNLLKAFNKGSSIAIMIDQRVSEGKKISFFNKVAFTTTIPAQLVKKFNCKVVPVHIERKDKYYFTVKFDEPIKFLENDSLEKITHSLNLWLEKMILKNPTQWIWTHNRWKI